MASEKQFSGKGANFSLLGSFGIKEKMRNLWFFRENSKFRIFSLIPNDPSKEISTFIGKIAFRSLFACFCVSNSKKEIASVFLGKITICSLFLFLNLIRESKRIASEKQFPVRVLIFLARIVRELKRKCEISNFPRKNHYSLAISFFEFDTQKQANSERKAIFPIKVLISLLGSFGIKEKMRNLWFFRGKFEISHFFFNPERSEQGKLAPLLGKCFSLAIRLLLHIIFKKENSERFLGKITIRSLFSFLNLMRKSKRIASEKHFPNKGANFPCSDRSGLKKNAKFRIFLGKITIRSLFPFLNMICKSKRIASEKQFSNKGANFPCSDRSGLRKMRNFEFSSEKSLFARYFFFEFDTQKQANSERKAIFPIRC